MEYTKGKWVRLKQKFLRGNQSVIDEIYDYSPTFDRITFSNGNRYGSNNIVKVADTPQELLQEGDMFFLDDQLRPYIVLSDRHIKHINRRYKDKVYIILTENKNGDFIKQWELEDIEEVE